MKRVVVSGATSMVGVALIEECIKHDVQVMALVRKNSKKIDRLPKSNYIEIVECDLCDMKNYVSDSFDFDVFYHLGWSNTDKEGRNDARRQLENINYSLAALDLAVRLGCKKFIGAGSQAEYGIHWDQKTGANSKLDPQDAYGICKAAAGKLCSLEAEKRKIDFFWVRIFSLFGKYELPGTLIQTTLPKMLRDERCSFTEGIHEWDYLYSADAGEAFYLIGEKARGNKVYCLGSGKSYPLRQYIQDMKTAIGSKSELGFGDIPYGNGLPKGMCADITDLQQDTGWKPKTTFCEGIIKEVDRLSSKIAKEVTEK